MPGRRVELVTDGGRVRADKVLRAGNASHRLARGKLAGLLFPATLGISDTYAHGDSGIFSVVYANIGGVWKLVAHAIEAGCT